MLKFSEQAMALDATRGETMFTEKNVSKVFQSIFAGLTTIPINGGRQPTHGNHQAIQFATKKQQPTSSVKTSY